ncbi:MAG: hypothetical protein KC505_03340 [Myxococcales bacterium]|nr:hypothetical protein [Myxococcales bacterium]USN49785.1 MAG: hypothetical protein H6731_05750 [Myxococcales bacterium]
MALMLKTKLRTLAKKTALILFAALLIWPIFHMLFVQTLHLSPWRLFGWGMYAAPTPQAQSLLWVVVNENNQKIDSKKLFNLLANLKHDPTQESNCINVFLQRDEKMLKRIPLSGLCSDSVNESHLEQFLHLGSTYHLKKFVDAALLRIGLKNNQSYAFWTHQRFNIFFNKAFLESYSYSISADNAHYLGKIRSERG